MTRPEEVAAVVAAIEILVNNAGMVMEKSTEEMTDHHKIRDDLSHGETGDEESVDPSEGNEMEQKGFEP